MNLRFTGIAGCAVVELSRFEDERGDLTKVVQATVLHELGLRTDFVEVYYSRSRRGVLRGLHLQVPPHEHFKLVHCLAGHALDVVLDVRSGSPTYGRHVAIDLRGDEPAAVAVPPGCAHGFLALVDNTTLGYWVTSEHAPAADTGIRWDSADIDWRLDGLVPIVSARDSALPKLSVFDSPFRSDAGTTV